MPFPRPEADLWSDRAGCPRCGSLSHSAIMTETIAARKASTRGIVLLGVVVLAWGTMWPVNKALLAYMPPIWSIALRTCISVLALFAISLGVTGLAAPKRGDAPVLISMVLLHMVGFTILTQLALQFVPAGQSTVLAYTSVLWAPMLCGPVPGRAAVAAPRGRARARRARPHRHLQPRDVRLERPRRRRWQRGAAAGRHAVGGEHRPQPRARLALDTVPAGPLAGAAGGCDSHVWSLRYSRGRPRCSGTPTPRCCCCLRASPAPRSPTGPQR